MRQSPLLVTGALLVSLCLPAPALALPQEEPRLPERGIPNPDGPPPGFFPGGPGQRMGPGGMGGMMGRVREILKLHDKDGNRRLDQDERKAAREAMKEQRANGGGGGFPGGRRGGGGFPGGGAEKATPGIRIAPADVKPSGSTKLFDENVIRTLFLEFENPDWEAELADFYHTDVDVPAKLIVDGKTYPEVGVSFRGASSYFTVPAGSKRSLNLSLDHADPKQRLYGHKTLNLLNGHEDPSFLHTVLYLHIARRTTPAPRANFVRLVVQGENWGIYTSAEQFDKDLLAANYPDTKGHRWKVQGSPGGRGGLEYLGEDLARYKQIYSLKSGESDGDKPWRALVALCYYLNETEPEHLVAALEPVLDIDSALWFLALEIVLVNMDGYWIRASDYAMYSDAKGRFHILPHDANETFSATVGGPGGRGGPGGMMGGGGGRASGVELDPLVGLDDLRKPLRSKLLAVPELRAKYLGFVKRIATESLDWEYLGPIVAQHRALLDEHVRADTKKLSSYEAFRAATAEEPQGAAQATDAGAGPDRRRGPGLSLRAFVEARRKFLLGLPALR